MLCVAMSPSAPGVPGVQPLPQARPPCRHSTAQSCCCRGSTFEVAAFQTLAGYAEVRHDAGRAKFTAPPPVSLLPHSYLTQRPPRRASATPRPRGPRGPSRPPLLRLKAVHAPVATAAIHIHIRQAGASPTVSRTVSRNSHGCSFAGLCSQRHHLRRAHHLLRLLHRRRRRLLPRHHRRVSYPNPKPNPNPTPCSRCLLKTPAHAPTRSSPSALRLCWPLQTGLG
jgi:hypothetical protein